MKQYTPKNTCFTLKIKDGIFLGKGRSPQLSEFLTNNKITCIINCAGLDIPSILFSSNVKVLTFNWKDNDDQTIISLPLLPKFQLIYSTIQQSISKHEAILICSLKGQSRSLTVLTAYLMRRYKWSLYKTLQYLNSRRHDFELRTNFLRQLVWYQNHLYGKKLSNCTKNWSEQELVQEGNLIKNTYLNSITSQEQKYLPYRKKKISKKQVSFHTQIQFIDEQPFRVRTIESQTIQTNYKHQQINNSITDTDFFNNKPTSAKKLKRTIKIKQSRSSSVYSRRQPTPYKISHQPLVKNIPRQAQIQLNINFNINSLNIISSSKQKSLLMNKLKQIQKQKMKKSARKNKSQKILMYLPPEDKLNKKPLSPYRRRISLKNTIQQVQAKSDKNCSFSINKKLSRRVKTQK